MPGLDIGCVPYREVGEGNIDLVLLGGMEAGPVGRAQQIDHLQQTVNHLQVKEYVKSRNIREDTHIDYPPPPGVNH